MDIKNASCFNTLDSFLFVFVRRTNVNSERVDKMMKHNAVIFASESRIVENIISKFGFPCASSTTLICTSWKTRFFFLQFCSCDAHENELAK